MGQVHARKDKIVDRPDQGHRVPVQEEQDRLDQGDGAAGRQGHGRRRRGRQADARRRRRSSSPPARRRAACPASRSITSGSSRATRRSTCTEVPKSLVIMGSGAVGVEFASIYRRFGSEVTIIELLPRLVPVEDEAVSAELEKSFKKQGIKSLTGTKVTKAVADAQRRRHRGAGRRRQDAEAVGRAAARGDRPRPGDHRPRRRGARHRDGEGLHQGGRAVSHLGAERLGDRRRDHARRPACTRSSRTCRRRKASSSPSGWPARTCSR